MFKKIDDQKMCCRQKNLSGGAALLTSVLFITIISVVTVLGFTSSLIREFTSVKEALISSDSYYAAEAANEDAYYRLKTGKTYNSPEVFVVDGAVATTTFTNVGGGNWTLFSQASKGSLVRKVQTSVSNTVTDADFPYGAQVGEGGIIMDNNALIQGIGGTDGDVYSNGSVVGTLGATITGDITVSTNIVEDVVERSIICAADENVGETDPDIDYAQSFVASSTSKLSKISLYLKKSTNPGNRTIYITADNAGSPDTVSLSDGELTASLVGVNYAWIDVVFPAPATLTEGNTYWIVFDATEHASKYWMWCNDTAGGYANGEIKYSEEWSSDPWTPVSGDLAFKLFWGEGFSEINNVIISGTAKANTIVNSDIGVDAYYQTISGTTVGGTSYPGSADPPVVAMPLSDANIASWRAVAEAGGVIPGDCPGDPACSLTIGPKKIDGDLTVPINETLTITGVLYVTGDVYPENNTQIKCDLSFGDQSCILLVDGNIDVSNNVLFSGSGDPDSFILALSTVENCLGGVQQPECAPQNSAIFVANNATGVIFYATDSQVYLNNGVNVTTVVAYQLHLANGVIVTYDTDVEDLGFASGPDSGWVFSGWSEVE